MKRHLALIAAIALSIVVYEITGVILRARAAQPVVVAETTQRRDPLDGLVPPMRTDPRPRIAPVR